MKSVAAEIDSSGQAGARWCLLGFAYNPTISSWRLLNPPVSQCISLAWRLAWHTEEERKSKIVEGSEEHG